MAQKRPAKTSKTTPVSDKPVPRSVQLSMVLAIIVTVLFLRPYIGAILFSLLVAFIFNPVYKRVLGRTNRQGLAITTTILTAIISFLLPLTLIVGITVAEAGSLANKVKANNANIGPAKIQEITEKGTDRVNNLVRSLPGGENFKLNKDKVSQSLKKAGTEIAQGVVHFIQHASGAFLGLFSTAILALLIIVNTLRYQNEVIKFIKDSSPFHESVTNLYLERTAAMTKAMVKGQLIIATVQGLASAFSLWIVGIDYFWFFFVILTFLSFIPLGGGILTIPIAVIIALTGNIGAGVFVLLFHFLVVTNIDNLLRPRLVPKNARLNSAFTMLSVFSGIALFGAPGIVYGPVIMILLVTTFSMYANHNRLADKQATLA